MENLSTEIIGDSISLYNEYKWPMKSNDDSLEKGLSR